MYIENMTDFKNTLQDEKKPREELKKENKENKENINLTAYKKFQELFNLIWKKDRGYSIFPTKEKWVIKMWIRASSREYHSQQPQYKWDLISYYKLFNNEAGEHILQYNKHKLGNWEKDNTWQTLIEVYLSYDELNNIFYYWASV